MIPSGFLARLVLQSWFPQGRPLLSGQERVSLPPVRFTSRDGVLMRLLRHWLRKKGSCPGARRAACLISILMERHSACLLQGRSSLTEARLQFFKHVMENGLQRNLPETLSEIPPTN